MEKHGRRFGETCLAKYVGDLEKHVQRFGETCSVKYVGDLEKHGRRFGETCSAKTLEIWRNVVGDLEKLVRRKHWRFGELVRQNTLAISYWSLLWSSLELGDRKWRLNRSGEKMETNYGDQNFIHHKVESTYMEHFKDRNI